MILAIDTSTAIASVALHDGSALLGSYTLSVKKKHSETILQMIEHLLKLTGTDFSDITAFAVTTGPGSFTGLRIGVSTVKGLAFASNKPCVAVSATEALAYNLLGTDGILCPVIDARRGNVYNALFSSSKGTITRLTEDRLIAIDELKEELLSHLSATPVHLIGNAAGTVKTKTELPVFVAPVIAQRANAESVAMIAAQVLADNSNSHTDLELSPVYLRPTQAERERQEKEKEKLL